MTVLRSTKWEFIGECWGYLVFQNRRFPDQKIFVREAKYVNMKTQAVHIMKAKSIGDSDSDIPYQKRHFSEYRG